MKSDIFWQLSISEVQEFAVAKLGRELTKSELIRLEKMFDAGIQWVDVLFVALNNIEDCPYCGQFLDKDYCDGCECVTGSIEFSDYPDWVKYPTSR